jgi:hypothetical protein
MKVPCRTTPILVTKIVANDNNCMIVAKTWAFGTIL